MLRNRGLQLVDEMVGLHSIEFALLCTCRVASFGVLAEDQGPEIEISTKQKKTNEILSAALPEIRRAVPLHVGMLRQN